MNLSRDADCGVLVFLWDSDSDSDSMHLLCDIMIHDCVRTDDLTEILNSSNTKSTAVHGVLVVPVPLLGRLGD